MATQPRFFVFTLFCTQQKLNSCVFKQIRTLWQKPRGVEGTGLKSGRYKNDEKKHRSPSAALRTSSDRPLQDILGSDFFGRCFGSWFSVGAGEGFFQHLGDAAVTGFGGAVVEDAEQVVAALQGSHGLPSLISAGIAGECALEDGRQVELGFHGGEQLFGDLFGAADTRCGVFYVDNPIADPLAHGKGELVEPAAEGAVFVEDALEFGGDDGDAFCGVRFEAELDGLAEGGVGSGLHAPFDEHAVIALAGGEDGRAKCEAVDFAFDSDLAAGSPHFRDVERDADNDPAESRRYALESGLKDFRDSFRTFLHGGFGGTRISEDKRRHAAACPAAEVARTKPACAALAIWPGRLCRGAFREAGNGFGFGLVDIEDGQQFGDLQDFLELAAQVAEAKRGTLCLHTVMRGNEGAESSAVNKSNVVHIEDNFLFSFGNQAFYFLAQGVAFLAEHK